MFDNYISIKSADVCTKLKMGGLQHMIDRADKLKTWDDQWRRDNPQKAAELPIEE